MKVKHEAEKKHHVRLPTSINGLTLKDLENLPEIQKFLQNKKKSTWATYIMRLWSFHKFTVKSYNRSIDQFIQFFREQDSINGDDIYQVLNNYINSRIDKVENVSIAYYTRTIRKLLVRNGIKIPLEEFKDKVDIPKKVKRQWYDIKKEIIDILSARMTERLKLYLLMLAATSMRPKEPLYLTLDDFNFEADPPTVFINGQFTKMKTDRERYLTKELVNGIKSWVTFKHRKRIIVYNKDGVIKRRMEQPEIDTKALLFGMRNHGYESNPKYMYNDLLKEFTEVRERLHMNQLERRNNLNYHRHKITFQSFRRRAKKVIEKKAGYSYSEWFIGHAGSDYWATEGGEEEAAKTFKEIERYLTYLDVTSLTESNEALESKQEALTEDLQKTKLATDQRIEELERQNKENQETIQKMQQILATLSNGGATIPLKNNDGKTDLYSPNFITPIAITEDYRLKYGKPEFSLTPSDTKIENELDDLVDRLKDAEKRKDKDQIDNLESKIRIREKQLDSIKKEQKRLNNINP